VSLDDQIRQALDRALGGVRTHLETDLRAFAQELLRVTTDERNQSVARATEAAVAEVRQKAHTQLADIRDAAQRHTDELRRSTDAQIADLKRTLAEAEREAQAEIEDARRLAQTQVDDVQRAMNERVAELERRLGESDHRLNDTMRELDEVRRASHGAEQARAISQRASHQQTVRLAAAVDRLDEAPSLSEVLDELGRAAARETERVAVLVVRDEQLVGWSLLGFGDKAPLPRAVSMDLATAGLAGTVVRTGSAESGNTADTNEQVALPPFARLPAVALAEAGVPGAGARDALALPVVVGGAVVAVLYADATSGSLRETEEWPSMLDLLARHASKVLEALTVQQAIGLSWRRSVARRSHDAVAGPSHDRSM
jgi:hypothetical protein